MNTPSLTVVALLQAKAGQERTVRDLLTSLTEPSRRDTGCLNYDLHQGVDDPTAFMFHENWTSKAELDAHLNKPDLQAVLARVVPLLAEPPRILLWHKIG